MIEAFGYTDEAAERMTAAEALEIRSELMSRGRDIVLAAPQLYIDADVEADGIAGHGSLLSIGAVSPIDPSDTFYIELQPTTDLYIPNQRAFCEKYGLERERLLVEGASPAEAMASFAAWIDGLKEDTGKPATLAALGAEFDYALLKLYFVQQGVDNPLHKAPIDLKTLALPLSPEWDWTQTTKNNLPPWLAPDREFTHNALEDSHWQQELHFAVVGALDVARSER